MKQWNFSLYSASLGRAARIFKPPKLWPIKDNRPKVLLGKF